MEKHLTGEQWQEELPWPKIMDPDGWRRDQCDWFKDTMPLEEYLQRLAVCTVQMKSSPEKIE